MTWRPGTAFGLQDNDLKSFSVGVDVAPSDVVGLWLSYGFENYATLQGSRQASPGVQFNDPTRDWSTDMNEDVHTFTASLELAQVTAKTSARIAYDLVRSNATYLYLLPANSTLAVPQQLPPVENDLRRATADVRYAVSRQVAIGLGYAYDRYDVEDFARSPGTLNSPVFATFVNLMYQSRPYDAHTGSLRLIYTW